MPLLNKPSIIKINIYVSPPPAKQSLQDTPGPCPCVIKEADASGLRQGVGVLFCFFLVNKGWVYVLFYDLIGAYPRLKIKTFNIIKKIIPFVSFGCKFLYWVQSRAHPQSKEATVPGPQLSV